jgi:opacity protein-like surface antigen
MPVGTAIVVPPRRRSTMKIRFRFALAMLAALAASDAFAAGVDVRQARQHHRIHAGVAQGDLTRRESVALHAQQAHIARVEHRLRSGDGVLGPYERLRLHGMQNRASRSIHRQRHDAQRR